MGKKKKANAATPSLFDDEQPRTAGDAAERPIEFPLPADLDPSWLTALEPETRQPYWNDLQSFVAAERAANAVYPPAEDVFNAFRYTPLDKVKVFLLGQDPYPGAGQAHGLCFSVRPGVRLPGSLRNIYKELQDDLGIAPVKHGYLASWANQGVLMLNACLTVRADAPNSHAGKGWENIHRRGPPRGERPEAADCVPAVGCVRPEEDPADRREAPRRHQVGAPVAAIGREWFLRQQTVLEGERGIAGSRGEADRLDVAGDGGGGIEAWSRMNATSAACF